MHTHLLQHSLKLPIPKSLAHSCKFPDCSFPVTRSPSHGKVDTPCYANKQPHLLDQTLVFLPSVSLLCALKSNILVLKPWTILRPLLSAPRPSFGTILTFLLSLCSLGTCSSGSKDTLRVYYIGSAATDRDVRHLQLMASASMNSVSPVDRTSGLSTSLAL